MNVLDLDLVRENAERAYRRFHSPQYIFPDPLQLLLPERDPLEREAVALVASAFALGRVGSILAAAGEVLDRLRCAAGSVRAGMCELAFADLSHLFRGFVYRFFGTAEVAGFLAAAGALIREWGSLEACFAAGLSGGDDTVLPALSRFSGALRSRLPVPCGILVTNPEQGASKRMHLFLRWMVRHDSVDPGGWRSVSPSRLIVPMDTHMLRVSRQLGITQRRTADIRTAMEVTEVFRAIRPDDPVRYDFSLTRYGIHPEGRSAAPELLRRPAASGNTPTVSGGST
ncbi:TIGR02757 family protein [Salinispira pacifica]